MFQAYDWTSVIDLHIGNKANDNLAAGKFHLYFLRTLPEAEFEDYSIGLADTAFSGLRISITENVTKIKRKGSEGRNVRGHMVEAVYNDENGNNLTDPKAGSKF